jgi:hypothetical protein
MYAQFMKKVYAEYHACMEMTERGDPQPEPVVRICQIVPHFRNANAAYERLLPGKTDLFQYEKELEVHLEEYYRHLFLMAKEMNYTAFEEEFITSEKYSGGPEAYYRLLRFRLYGNFDL